MHPPAYSHCPRTGRSLRAGTALIGRVIADRYKIVGVLGEGGMGAVYLAEHLMIGRKVALKRLHPELAADAKAVQRFLREARAAAATGHEHIVEILDLGYADDGAPYLVMEHLRGHGLAQRIKEEAPLPAARACRIVGQVLAALEAVHREGIVHRDLKPDNVFLTRRAGQTDYVKVLDFGISKMKHDDGSTLDLTKTGVLMGTPYYMSPEQARGMRTFDLGVDLYAAGVILYECLTGRLPYQGENYHALLQAILRSEPRAPSSLAAGIDPGLEAVVMRALAKTAASRFSSARAMHEALVPFGAEPPGTPELESDAVSAATVTARAELPGTPTEALPDGRTLLSPRGGAHGEEGAAARASARGLPAIGPAFDPELAAGASRGSGTKRKAPSSPALPRVTFHSGPHPYGDPAAAPSAPTSRAPGSTSVPGLATPRGQEPALKGAFFFAALEHVEERFGRGGLDRVLASLEPAVRERLTGVILPMAWLAPAIFDSLLRAVERELGTGDGSTAVAVGRAIAEREAQSTHRLFMQTATPSLAVERIPHFFRLYHPHGACRVRESTPTSLRLEMDTGIPESVLYASATAGFFQRFLEIAGAKDVKGHAVASRAQGDKETIVALRWR